VARAVEEALPVFDFRASHSRWIDASQDRVWAALTGLTFGQLSITRPLVAMRHVGSRSTPVDRNLFEDGPVELVLSVPGEFAVGAVIARPWRLRPARLTVGSMQRFVAFRDEGWVKYLVSFELAPGPDGVLLTTETRGVSTDPVSRRRFALYWAIIGRPSGLVRRDMLRAVARAAEAGPTAKPA
jgi:hypothetical protein